METAKPSMTTKQNAVAMPRKDRKAKAEMDTMNAANDSWDASKRAIAMVCYATLNSDRRRILIAAHRY